eukprot:scaffold114238_cov44-Phaeocystis_antarctica.AAC.2
MGGRCVTHLSRKNSVSPGNAFFQRIQHAHSKQQELKLLRASFSPALAETPVAVEPRLSPLLMRVRKAFLWRTRPSAASPAAWPRVQPPRRRPP